MQFLKTLFWVVIAAGLILFARDNWHPVTLNLWSDIQADVKLPALLLFVFLLGFVPLYVVHRARLWKLRRQYERASIVNQPVAAPPPATSEEEGTPSGDEPSVSPAVETQPPAGEPQSTSLQKRTNQ